MFIDFWSKRFYLVFTYFYILDKIKKNIFKKLIFVFNRSFGRYMLIEKKSFFFRWFLSDILMSTSLIVLAENCEGNY